MKLIERLTASFRAAMLAPEGYAPPVAILWTDAEGQWQPILPALRAVFPWVYTLGKYNPETKTGPAIWLKCIVDRTLPEAPPPGETPVLYLPHVRRQELRAAGDCPPHLQPLVELQYRGRVWHQSNGHDWTVRAFLVSDDGLGLDVAADRRTEEAMLRALPLLAEIDLSPLRGRRVDADDFDKLSVQDPVRDLLLWLNHPETFEAGAKGARWESFRSVVKSEFGLDPEKTSPSEVAGLLLRAELGLDRVWTRFVEAPQLYAGVAKLLRDPAGVGQGLLALAPERDPRINEREEDELRQALEAASRLAHAAACVKVLELEARHGERRAWVWARLGWSPWAEALEPLARLARAAQTPVGGGTLAAADRGDCRSAALADGAGGPVTPPAAVLAHGEAGADPVTTVLVVPGMHCAGCMAKVERSLHAVAGVSEARVNLTARQVRVAHDPAVTMPQLMDALTSVGFASQPRGDTAAEAPSAVKPLLAPVAVAGFACMNVMLLSVSIWSGAEGATKALFHWLSAGIGVPAIIYSGMPFFKSAWGALRRGTTNMDVPISIGVILATALSLFETVRSGEHAYFDASATLLFFLLAGRTLDYLMRERARSAITNLARIAPRGATRVHDDGRREYVSLREIEPAAGTTP